jgi:hypothetical protein
MAIRAKINSNTSAGPQNVSVTVPSSVGSQSFKALSDVDTSSLSDGALIQYDADTKKFTTTNELKTTEGSLLRFSGGNF